MCPVARDRAPGRVIARALALPASHTPFCPGTRSRETQSDYWALVRRDWLSAGPREIRSDATPALAPMLRCRQVPVGSQARRGSCTESRPPGGCLARCLATHGRSRNGRQPFASSCGPERQQRQGSLTVTSGAAPEQHSMFHARGVRTPGIWAPGRNSKSSCLAKRRDGCSAQCEHACPPA